MERRSAVNKVRATDLMKERGCDVFTCCLFAKAHARKQIVPSVMRHVRVLMRSIGFVDLFIQNVYIVPVFFLSILWTQIVNVGRKTISLVVRSQVEMSFRGKMPLVKNGATKISFRGVDFGGPFTCDHHLSGIVVEGCLLLSDGGHFHSNTTC